MADQTNIPVTLQAKIDEKSIAQATARFKDLQRQLKGMGVDWGKVAKYATSATTEIQAISDAAAAFSKKLGMATMDSVGHLKKLGDQLEDAQQKAEELADAYKGAESGAREGIAKQMGEQAKEVAKLTQQIHEYRSAQGKQIQQLNKLIKVQDRYQKSVTDAAKFDSGDMFEGIKNKLASGNLKGLFGDIGGGIKKSIEGKFARGAMESAAAKGGMGTEAGAAEIASAAKMMSGAGLALGASVAAFGAFVMLVKAASDHMTGLNKALINGMGYANDFVSDAKGYRKVMDEMRHAAIDSHGAMLKFGKSSEDVMKIINSYAKESTGSLIKTRNTMEDFGKGNLQFGVEQFAKNAIVYGKALNMEAEDAAAMMGKMQSEMGYGASQIQGLMQDVVKSAATASMPMSKFMDIFKSVIPDVELYRNRLEELTGTIKLLSKTMSPRDVKQFMDGFAKGFSGTDFKQRLKTALVVGVPRVSEIAAKDFSSKAGVMAAKFSKYLGVDGPKRFMTAFQSGEKGMAGLINEMQATASQMGESLSGTDIGEAMKLASYESARQKGGPLNTATAMRGMGMFGTYKVLKEMSQKFTSGFDGLSEHVIAQLGISDQQYQALRQTNQSMTVWKDMLGKYGKTNSKSMNDALRESISIRKFGDKTHAATVDLRDATEEDLFAASQQHEEDMKTEITASDLAQEQVSATTSISDKISNVIAFLLEKLYNVMQPILDLLDDMWSWIVGDEDQKKLIKQVQEATDKFVQQVGPGAQAEQAKLVADAVSKGVSAGKGGADLGEYVARSGAITAADLQGFDVAKVGKYAEKQGMGPSDAAVIQEAFYQAMKQGNMVEAMRVLEKIPGKSTLTKSGNMESTLLSLFGGQMAPSEEAQRRAAGKAATSRPGTEAREGPKKLKERIEADKLAKEASDLETLVSDDRLKAANVTRAQFSKMDPAAKAAAGLPVTPAETAAATGTRRGQTVYGPEAGLTQQQFEATKAASSPGAPGSPGTKTAKAADTMTSLLEAIQAAGDSTVVQAMGISMHLDEIEKLLKGPGVHLNKTKFAQEVAMSTLKPMLDDSLATAFLDYFMYSAKSKDVESMLQDAKDEGAKTVKEAAKQWGIDYQEKFFPKPEGARDFGGKIDTTGYYRLMRGEEVVNPSLNGGTGGSRSVTINATINVNGSGDPRATAAIVRSTLYDMSEKH